MRSFSRTASLPSRHAGGCALLALAGAAALAADAVFAYPEGAPWGAANPDASESCGSCHYDYTPQPDSSALSIAGLPRSVAPGQEYEFIVRFADDAAIVSGFQLLASAGDADAGVFRADSDAIEAIGAASRSTKPLKSDGCVSWRLSWRAPEAIDEPIVLYLAASAANDDQSPFGDTIHYRSFTLAPAGTD